jgi:hypothetical protein
MKTWILEYCVSVCLFTSPPPPQRLNGVSEFLLVFSTENFKTQNGEYLKKRLEGWINCNFTILYQMQRLFKVECWKDNCVRWNVKQWQGSESVLLRDTIPVYVWGNWGNPREKNCQGRRNEPRTSLLQVRSFLTWVNSLCARSEAGSLRREASLSYGRSKEAKGTLYSQTWEQFVWTHLL